MSNDQKHKNIITELLNNIKRMKIIKKISTITKYRTAAAIALLLVICAGNDKLLAGEPAKLFNSDEIINIELRSDFTALEKDRTGEPQYHDGELKYYNSAGDTVTLNVGVMVRGNFRRDPSICNFPPLMINFKKKEVQGTLFDDQDKLKLVTPCDREEEVLKEYAVYRLYNEVTDYSFRVRLARISYFDTSTRTELFERYSFFLEDKDHVAERNDHVAKDRFLTPFDLETESFRRLAVFQFLVGNKDWYVSSRKNLVILQPDGFTAPPVAVPYDFDLAGLVDAAYSKPEGVPAGLLADKRVYRGICYTEDELSETFDFFMKLRPRFEEIISGQDFIPRGTKKDIIRYLDKSYGLIENEYLFSQMFGSSCQTRKDYNLAELK